jgi:phosphohistidine phosphatase
MLRLLLLRHAKAAQDSGEGDFARALTSRGRSDAVKMGRALDTHAYIPDLVLCSPAKRTAETLELLIPELAKAPRVEFLKSLYLASPRKIFDAVCDTLPDVKTVMTVGHNPGMEDLADKLARKPQSKAEAAHRETLREKFPTCGLAVLDFDTVAWSKIEPSTGALTDFLRPKEISD